MRTGRKKTENKEREIENRKQCIKNWMKVVIGKILNTSHLGIYS